MVKQEQSVDQRTRREVTMSVNEVHMNELIGKISAMILVAPSIPRWR